MPRVSKFTTVNGFVPAGTHIGKVTRFDYYRKDDAEHFRLQLRLIDESGARVDKWYCTLYPKQMDYLGRDMKVIGGTTDWGIYAVEEARHKFIGTVVKFKIVYVPTKKSYNFKFFTNVYITGLAKDVINKESEKIIHERMGDPFKED